MVVLFDVLTCSKILDIFVNGKVFVRLCFEVIMFCARAATMIRFHPFVTKTKGYKDYDYFMIKRCWWATQA